ncbi:arylesterase [Aureimonas pseudogalii]|uniref:Acyl-CoA thioesterase-1 n=1 Tax=Aureimonas pseudogalii TaxID=1744844 RepID=A0A7W6EC47_9HYPH|nr:arylesterase [Aureimonas pseudogalii]MBB3997301.1 acyl-CoA thioesterase-1 [Aureimonas pseudogalii]
MPDGVPARTAAAALSLLGFAVAAAAPTAAQSSPRPIRIVAFGDSLVAGYGLRPGEAFPAQLQAALRARGYDVSVANAGVSGDTTAAALTRAPRAVPAGTDLAIVELGANDILRGVPPAATERNLDAILRRVSGNADAVILAGMIAPPGLGNAFSRSFDPIYERLAERHGATLYPFFLTGVAGRANLNLPDRIHPNAAGVRRIVEGILPTVRRQLDALARRPAALD